MLLVSRIVTELRRAWSDSKVLTAGSLLMLVAFVASVIGIVFDDTIVTGVPAWLKPAKFSISTSIFLGTMAWIYRYITVWPGFMRALGWVLSGVLVVEVAIISIQAVRGTPSHFNVATSVDGALFGIMGVAIAMLWLAMVGVSVALFRQNFPDPAWGWSLRLAVLVTVLGSAAGGMMLRLTPEQSEAFRRGEPLTAAGAHTVGAPDGGNGIPGVGWSTDHGDLRIPHFFGLHGFQVLPLLGWLTSRRRRTGNDRKDIRVAFMATASYVGLFGILTWQALQGQSVLEPDIATLLVLAFWVFATAGAVGVFSGKVRRAHASPASRATT